MAPWQKPPQSPEYRLTSPPGRGLYLSLASRYAFKHNSAVDGTDWRPDKYIEMYKDILKDPDFGK